MLRNLASWSFRHRWLACLAWLVVALGIAFAGSASAGPEASGSLNGSDAGAAYDLLEEGFGPAAGGETVQIVVADDAGVARHLPAITAAADTLRATPGVLAVTTATQSPVLTAPDGAATLISVDLALTSTEAGSDVEPAALDATTQARRDLEAGGARAEIASWMFNDGELPASELFGLAAAVIILLVAFGSVVAMGLALLTAILGVAGALGLVGLWANVLPTPDFATQVAAVIGLGVGIDYALLIVTRYRLELGRGLPFHDATVEAIATAGRVVVLAGTTVVVSLLGMVLIGLDIMQGVGVTAASSVVVAVAAVTLLPALLAIVGRRIDSLSLHRRRNRRAAAPAAAFLAAATENLALMAEGRTNAAIAAALVVGEGAVEKHISSMFSKLNLEPSDTDHRRVMAVLTDLRH